MSINIIQSMETVTEQVRLGELPRRKIRNLIFRIAQNKVWEAWQKPLAPGLSEIISSQFKPVDIGGQETYMAWDNFSTVWDIHPEDPLLIITKREWFHAGGKFDDTMNILIPTAFTHQQIGS